LKEYSEINKKSPAANERFGAMAGVSPQKRQCDFASFAPAQASVNPPLPQAAATLAEMRGRQSVLTNE